LLFLISILLRLTNKTIFNMKQQLLTLLFLLFCVATFAQPTISVVGAPFMVNAPMTFTYAGAPGNTTDWIGVYLPGEIPDGDPPSLTWEYITSPSGDFTLNGQNQAAQLKAGEYTVHLFCCDGYTSLASANFTIVGEAPADIDITRYAMKNDSAYFKYNGGTGSPLDWIGIYKAGAVPGADQSLIFEYVASAAGTKNISIDSLKPGVYDAHLFCCDGYDSLASMKFTVYDSLAPALSFVGNPEQNKPITFNFAGGTGSLLDWIGIYTHGDVPGNIGSIYYEYVNGANGSKTFDTIPTLMPGTFYDAHLFCCDGYTILKSIENFTVGTSATTDLTNLDVFYAISQSSSIEVYFKERTSGTLNVFNSMGQLAKSATVDNDENLQFHGLRSGAYIMQFQGKKGFQYLKIIVH
jgi:hypothetical protein